MKPSWLSAADGNADEKEVPVSYCTKAGFFDDTESLTNAVLCKSSNSCSHLRAVVKGSNEDAACMRDCSGH
jgi:hypothetical protein